MDTDVKFISIIGYGYVGSATGYLCEKANILFSTCDILRKYIASAIKSNDSIYDTVIHSEMNNKTNIYFISVPTPSKVSGECDISVVESVLSQIASLHTKNTIVYIKSTVSPGTCRRLHSTYGSKTIQIVFCPEFLREKTHTDDMYNAKFVLLGTADGENKAQLTDIFYKLYKHNPDLEIIVRPYEECEMFKNTINVYLAVKVWFFNKIHEMCGKVGFPYENLQSLFRLDSRIGESHTQVPGHDGYYGFGGACLPKETKSLRYLQEVLEIDDTVLYNILKENDIQRYNKH